MTTQGDFKVHKINEQEDIGPEGLTNLPVDGELGFTIKGENIDVESTDCFCKVVTNNNKIVHYFIKTGINGFMFNPWGMFSEGMQAIYAKHMGRPVWNFSGVNEECFQYYLKFLQSQNKAWLLQAERAI